MNLESTGLAFTSEAQARAYWSEHAPADAPEFSEEHLPHMRYLNSYASWADLIAAREQIEDLIDRPSDPYRYSGNAVGIVAQAFDELLAEHRPNLDTVQGEEVLAVWQNFIRILPKLGGVPRNHQEDSADYVWSTFRCFLCGAGYLFWRELSTAVLSLYPNCPFNPDDTLEEWRDAMSEAHQNCGLPVQVSWLPWQALVAAGDIVQVAEFPEHWLTWVTALHILKYTRRYDEERMEVMYRSRYVTFYWRDMGNTVGSSTVNTTNFANALNLPTIKAKDTAVNVFALAFRRAASCITGRDLRVRKPLSALPPLVLYGEWSRMVSAISSPGSFLDIGMSLERVLVAVDGRIADPVFDADDVLGYAWPYGELDTNQEWELYRSALPSTYEAAFPYDTFYRYFPHYANHATDPTALACIFDAPIFASLLRYQVAGLHREFPLVIFMPDSPTLDESTSQGKSLAASAYLRALCPHAILESAPDSGSAPDNRVLGESIRRTGTLGLDEWKVVSNKQSLLASDNLQSLCTGAAVAVGRAMENATGVRLSESVVLSSKVTEFKPDLYNRSFPHFLCNLAEDVDPDVVDYISGPGLSFAMRLGAAGYLDKYDWITDLNSKSSRSHRFGKHARIVEILYFLRTGEWKDLTQTFQEMTRYHQEHTDQAQSTGLADVVRTDQHVVLTLNMMFHDIEQAELERLNEVFQGRGGALNPRQLLMAAAAIRDMRLGPWYFQVAGNKPPNERAMIAALERDLRLRFPNPGDRWAFPGELGIAGWYIERGDAKYELKHQ